MMSGFGKIFSPFSSDNVYEVFSEFLLSFCWVITLIKGTILFQSRTSYPEKEIRGGMMLMKLLPV